MTTKQYGSVVYLRKDNIDEVIFVTDDGQEFIIRYVTSFKYELFPGGIPEVSLTVACTNDLEITTGIQCS